MKVTIPYELMLKFIKMEGFSMHKEYYKVNVMGSSVSHSIPGEPMISVKLDLSDEPKLLQACAEWMHIIETYFKTSYKAYKLNIGPYEGLWPKEIVNGVVTFNVDVADTKKRNWRDWFIKEDYEYAPF